MWAFCPKKDNLGKEMEKQQIRTRILHYDRRKATEAGGVHQPIQGSAEFAFPKAQELIDVFQGKPGFTYARQATPSIGRLEHLVSEIEDGVGTVCFSSGMAAISAVFFTLLRAGDHVVSSQYLFGNTNSLYQTLRNFGVEVTLVDACDVDAVAAAWQPNTRMVFSESIANPGTQVADLIGIGELCAARKVPFEIGRASCGKECRCGWTRYKDKKRISVVEEE